MLKKLERRLFLKPKVLHSSVIHSNAKVKQLICPSNDEQINKMWWGSPGDSVVTNSPVNTGDMGSIPGPGRFPHAAEQLSACATTTEQVL